MASGLGANVGLASDAKHDSVCIKCELKHLNTEADFFCQDCFQSICQKCVRKDRTHEGHTMIGKSEKHRWGIMDEFERCDVHASQVLTEYCKTHRSLCCKLCVLHNHRQCDTFEQIGVVSKGIRTTEEYKHVLHKLDTTVKELRQYNDSYTVQKKEVLAYGEYNIEEIKDFRHRINSILDQLEQEAIATEKKQTHEIASQLQSHADECVTLQTLLNNRLNIMSSTHNDNLAFIQCEKVREIVTRAQLHIQKMVRREGKISNFKGNKHIIQMLSGKEKFGESFVTGYYASSVCMKKDHSVHVADDKKTCLINAICELNNSQIAITDFNNNRLKLLDAVFEIVCVFDLPCAPNDVCRINNNSIAVALNNNTLLVFNVIESGFKLIRQIKFPFSCNAVACHKDNLYIAADTDLYTSTVKGHNRKRINNTTLEPGSVNFCKVSNDGGHIYITGNNEIVIADISSHSFDRIDKHPGMKDSRGMHITECGKVLVCDQGRHSVFIMEGKRLSSFIDSLEYCPPMPIAVCYTRHNPCLIIGHQDRNTITVLRLNISI